MDYKEKYEMALEGIQEILGSGEDSIKMSRLKLRLRGIFPELESKDERIRKLLIDYFSCLKSTLDDDGMWKGFKIDDIIAYIGKQKEWEEEDSYMLGQAIKCVNNSGKLDVSTEKIEYWLKSIGPQKKWKPSEDQMTALAEALGFANNCGEENAFDLRTLYEQLKKLKGE